MQILCAQLDGVNVVGTAHDGEAALRMIETLSPDLLLLDVAVPGLDGMAVARVLQARPARPTLVFCTAYDQHALAAFDVAAADYVLKPVCPERLARAIEQVKDAQAAPQVTVAQPDRLPLAWRKNSECRTGRTWCGSARRTSTGSTPSATICA